MHAARRVDLASLPEDFDLEGGWYGLRRVARQDGHEAAGVLEGFTAQIVEGRIKVSDKP